jgi:ActR/RegA family two-component response regulator
MGPAKRLLLVDDEDTIVFAMRRYFCAQGFDVDSARELNEARGLLSRGEYAAAIVDLRLTGVQGVEGLDVLSHIQEHCPRTRAILLTAYGSRDLDREARKRGADLVLSKPQPLPDLAQVLMGLIAEDPSAV